MTIDNKENLIFNDKEGKTQLINKEQLKEAWELLKVKDKLILMNDDYNKGKHLTFCANYNRDNEEQEMLIKQHQNPEKWQPVEKDEIVEAVRNDLLQRSQKGIEKYGVKLTRKDIDLKGWLQHLYEETLDSANYIKRTILELEKKEKTT